MESEKSADKKIIIVSDGIGNTAREIADCTMAQFPMERFGFRRFMNIRTKNQIDAIFTEPNIERHIILFTLVSQEMRDYLMGKARDHGTHAVDLLGHVLQTFSRYLNLDPIGQAGLHRKIDEDYFNRVAAMEFTLFNDDGKSLTSLDSSDLILVGISRTSKTPLSLFLAQYYSLRVVNIPIIPGTEPPEALFQVDQRKVFGLSINPERLREIRKNRLIRLGAHEFTENYAEYKTVIKEIEWANKIFEKNKKWTIFDVTSKAIEETAAEIVKRITMRKNNIFKGGP